MLGGLRRVAYGLSVLLLSAGAVGTAHADPGTLAAWRWSDQGVPGGAAVVERVGTVSIQDGSISPERPYAFVRASDGNLWLNWWTGSSWGWSNQGSPAGGIVGGVGVVGVKDSPSSAERPYAFVRGGDGNLWLNWWTGSGWSWSNLGAPSGGTADGIGVVTVKDTTSSSERPYVFVRGGDGNLWLNWWSGSSWAWSNQGMPSGGISFGAGVTTVKNNPASANRPYVFVRGGDGNLWINWWTGSSWSWSNQGAPGGGIAGGIDAITARNTSSAADRPYVFVRGADGNLWLNWWSGSSWSWSNQGAPGGGVAGGVGAVSVQDSPSAALRPYAFVRGGDGNLWVHWWTGRAWGWANQGAVSGGVADGIGVTTVKDGSSASQRPYAFVRTATGSLAVNWWG